MQLWKNKRFYLLKSSIINQSLMGVNREKKKTLTAKLKRTCTQSALSRLPPRCLGSARSAFVFITAECFDKFCRVHDGPRAIRPPSQE